MKKIMWLLLIIMPIILLGATTPSTGQNVNFGMNVPAGARKDSERFSPAAKTTSKQPIQRQNEWLRAYKAVPPPGAPKKEIGAPKTMAPETKTAPSKPAP
jgi:hypothetical protein